MLQRVVIPELLDHLPEDDPHAMRSRRDLRRINFLMGNERWILGTLARFPDSSRGGIIELGAGMGACAARLPAVFRDHRSRPWILLPHHLISHRR